jgi:acyl-CoA oxidase
MGSVLGLGNDSQIKQLDDFQDKGVLGCFSLTEKFAGVNSGMVVNTVADYNAGRDTFTLRCPNDGARKNWISQGLCADKTVVVADLRIGDKSFGPHAFLVDMRVNGALSPGITVGDMGRKTVGNDLDNAWISFDSVEVPKAVLLNRFGDIEDGAYVQKVKGMPVFHMIGQRLFTGRVAVAQAAYEFRRTLFATTRSYTDSKKVWSPTGADLSLSDIPQVRALYAEEHSKGEQLKAFLMKCEAGDGLYCILFVRRWMTADTCLQSCQ